MEKLKQKIKDKFSFKVTPTEQNKNMLDFEGYHFKISITNKETKQKATFSYSVGLGHKDRLQDETLFYGLVSCLYSDLPYIDFEEFKGLGYDEDSIKANKIYKNICKQYDKTQKIGFINFFECLTEAEKELIQEGF